MQFGVEVAVHHKEGVADPQGATIERALPQLGFDGVSDVGVGKLIRFTIEAGSEDAARAEVDDMVARFLTNPVIEVATVRLTELSGAA
jgi:phosphoribosylformylglycinamidine synthase subunit PurS